MKARVKIEGPVLEITFTGVQDSDRGRMANIEIALLRALGNYKREPWIPTRVCAQCGEGERYTGRCCPESTKVWSDDHDWQSGYLVQLVRGDSTHKDYATARKVLQGFALEV